MMSLVVLALTGCEKKVDHPVETDAAPADVAVEEAKPVEAQEVETSVSPGLNRCAELAGDKSDPTKRWSIINPLIGQQVYATVTKDCKIDMNRCGIFQLHQDDIVSDISKDYHYQRADINILTDTPVNGPAKCMENYVQTCDVVINYDAVQPGTLGKQHYDRITINCTDMWDGGSIAIWRSRWTQ